MKNICESDAEKLTEDVHSVDRLRIAFRCAFDVLNVTCKEDVRRKRVVAQRVDSSSNTAVSVQIRIRSISATSRFAMLSTSSRTHTTIKSLEEKVGQIPCDAATCSGVIP